MGKNLTLKMALFIRSSVKNSLNAILLLLLDLVALAMAIELGHEIRLLLNSVLTEQHTHPVSHYLYFWVPYLITLLLFYYEGIYTKRYDFWEELKYIVMAIVVSFILTMAILALMKSAESYSRLMLTLSYFCMFFTVPLIKLAGKYFLQRLGIWQRQIWFVNGEGNSSDIQKTLLSNWYLGYSLGDQNCYDTYVILSHNFEPEKLHEIVNSSTLVSKEVILIPYLKDINLSNSHIYELMQPRLNLISIQNSLLKPGNLFIKKIAEMALLLVILPLLLPVLSVVAFLVKTDSAGPVFFRQERMGRHGHVFQCYKFRTMHEEGEKILQDYFEANPSEAEYYRIYKKLHNDPRVTKVGRLLRKYSLDELPQIINVLKGEMNLVGPRPYMLSEQEDIGISLDIVLSLAPGMTGLWQVSGRNQLTFDERVDIDVWYIRNWTLWLDFTIFIKTFKVLLTRDGAH